MVKFYLGVVVGVILSLLSYLVGIRIAFRMLGKEQKHEPSSCRCSSPSCKTCAYCGEVWPCRNAYKEESFIDWLDT